MLRPDLVPLAELLDARLEQLVESFDEGIPSLSPFYAALPSEARREAARSLYRHIRDSMQDGGLERFAEAIRRIGHARLAQGGVLDDLRAATNLVRQLNFSLVEELVRSAPAAAVPAFAWLDEMSVIAFQVFENFSKEALARQAQELEISVAISERLERARGLREISDALFAYLPALGVDRVISIGRMFNDPRQYEVVAVFDRDAQTPLPALGVRLDPAPLLRGSPPGTSYLPVLAEEVDLPDDLRALLLPADIATFGIFPSWVDQEARGMALLGFRQTHDITPAEQRFIGMLMRQIGSRISNLRMTEHLQEQIKLARVFQALVQSANDMILIIDTDATITYANAATARALGFERPQELHGQPYLRFLAQESQAQARAQVLPQLAARQPWSGVAVMTSPQGESIPVNSSLTPLVGADGVLLGFGAINHDERERLELIESLRQSNADLMHTLDLLRQISTPLVPVMEGILVMPIVGDIDNQRAGQILETLLEGITSASADTVILDITGVPVVDTSVANALLQAARAARLLGADVVLVGITPEVAQALVGLGVELHGVVTRGDLSSGIAYALRRRGLRIVRDGTPLAASVR